MSVIKQSIPRKYMMNLKELIDSKEISDYDEYECYSECCNLLIQKDLYSNPYNELFDYFSFKFVNISDCSSDVKKIFKRNKIDSNKLLIYIYRITSIIVKYKQHRVGTLDDKVLVTSITLNSYKLFLMYCFDIVYGNKRVSINGEIKKYKDLDTSIELVNKSSKTVKTGIQALMLSINPITNEERNRGVARKDFDIKDSDIALFQKTIFKYEYILLMYLIDNILVEEKHHYLNTDLFDFHVLGSLISELRDYEFCRELSEEYYTLLKKRAFLIPKNGISINPKQIGFGLDLFERQFDGDNYLVVITRIKNLNYYTIINLNKEFCINNSPYLYDICNFLYSLYKLDDYAESIYGKEFSDNPHMLLSFKTDSFITEGVHIIKGKSDVYSDFTVEIPYYWRYRAKVKTPSQSKKDFLNSIKEGNSFVYISAFKRSLPVGRKASARAIELSKFYCLELEENETLVSPYVRSY